MGLTIIGSERCFGVTYNWGRTETGGSKNYLCQIKNREPSCLAHPPFCPSEILPALLVPVTILPSKVLSRQDNRPGESHEIAYNIVGEVSPQEGAFHVLLMACPDEMSQG